MGGSHPTVPSEELELHCSHPKLAGARLASLNGHSLIKITTPFLEKEYHRWAEDLLVFKKSTSKLMMPVKHAFTPAGLCGELGSADVLVASRRCTTPSSPTPSGTNSRTAGARSTPSLNKKSGTWSSASPRHNPKTCPPSAPSPPSPLPTSSSTRRARSGSPTPSPGRTVPPNSTRLWRNAQPTSPLKK